MKIKLLKIINPILALLFLIMLATLIMFKLSVGGSFAYEAHETCGLLFFILGLVHIYLNWNWIKANIFRVKPKK